MTTIEVLTAAFGLRRVACSLSHQFDAGFDTFRCAAVHYQSHCSCLCLFEFDHCLNYYCCYYYRYWLLPSSSGQVYSILLLQWIDPVDLFKYIKYFLFLSKILFRFIVKKNTCILTLRFGCRNVCSFWRNKWLFAS